ncbi:MAG: DUF4956 domain-containing protein [Clostridia bacterium]|nr:DUF4956 domain-containing protein [Clostridia bacterium]
MQTIFQSVLTGGFDLTVFFMTLGVSLLCGVLCALAASFRAPVTKSFLISLVLLPMIVNTVILMVNGNVGTGVAVMGAFSLVRFRSVPGKAREIAVLFLAMTSGLACAAGFLGYAVLFTVAACAVILLLSLIPFKSEKEMDLRITVPETLAFGTAFDEVFSRYTKSNRLVRTKTSNMGSLYKLQYRIRLKNEKELRSFVDALRERNGNLEISLMHGAEEGESL